MAFSLGAEMHTKLSEDPQITYFPSSPQSFAHTYLVFTCLRTFYSHGIWASLIAQLVKNVPAMQETLVKILGWEDRLEKG